MESGNLSDFEILVRDALRYRFLREENALSSSQGLGFAVTQEEVIDGVVEGDHWVGIDLDAILDEAMKQ